MKVTVCFGPARFVVPCPPGTTVRKLEQEAIIRYKRKNPDSWVVVHHLQSQSGILDPDDHIGDVADDREEIIASYDDCPGGPDPGVPQGGGDGASGSSVGTGSPDIFRSEPGKYGPESSTPHIEVTSTEQPPMGLGLQVRRGSEPSLHQIGVTDQRSPLYNVSPNGHQDTKRWSAAPVCRSDTEPPERLLSPSNGVPYLSPEWNVLPEEESHDSLPQQFSRSGRLSMQFLGAEAANGYRWMDAAERVATTAAYNGTSANSSFSSKSLPRESKRKEPLGQANASVYESLREKDGEMLLVVNENGGPLGLTALPDPDYGGLLVQSVEPDSRADRGRLRRGDRILEINNIKLVGLSESSVQEHLKKSLSSPELRLRVIRAGVGTKYKRDNRVSQMIEAEEKPTAVGGAKVATVSPTRKVPGAPTGISLQAANTRKLGKRIEISLKKGMNGLGFSVTTRDNQAGGQCPIYIKNILSKGAAVEDGRLKPGDRLLEVDGVPMTGKSQSEVVAILRATEYGATVRIVVSRQQELAEVEEREIGCGVESEQKSTPPKPPPPVLPKSSLKQGTRARSEEMLDTHDSAVTNVRSTVSKNTNSSSVPPPIQKKPLTSILKSASTNQVSELLQDQPSQFSSMPGAGGIQWKNREILTLHIPVHDTEKAGLGVSVKGKTGSGNSSGGSGGSGGKHDGDLGIFVKSVLHGGAASRDGRLKMNDQLLSVNGVSLLGQSNAEAMDTLRRAMLQTGGTNHPGKIILTVARRIGRPISTGELLETIDNSNSSEQSGATVIYLSPDKQQSQQQSSSEKQQQQQQHKRYSNPVLDRLTGGTGQTVGGSNDSLNHHPTSANGSPTINQRPSPLAGHGLRNESYYMATNDNWSPAAVNLNGSNAVLIEEDPEPTSPTFHLTRPSDGGNSTSTPNGDVTYASQLSLDTNPPASDAFSRDAIGRRSMSEKHHAALDARETGTYQRNKKLREERERERQLTSGVAAGSVESVTQMGRMSSLKAKSELRAEALDRLGELGPSLGMKKSSSLESLQTMVQEIQMADEPRGPNALRTPRGRGREEVLRAAVERPPETRCFAGTTNMSGWPVLVTALLLLVAAAYGNREHKVHNIVLYPDKHSWCSTRNISQVISYPGCKQVTIDNNVCVGACFSYSIPHTEPSDPGEVIGPYCDSCQPSETSWHHVTLDCSENSSNNNDEESKPAVLVKRVQIIKNCSCTSCEKQTPKKHHNHHHQDYQVTQVPSTTASLIQNDIPELLEVVPYSENDTEPIHHSPIHSHQSGTHGTTYMQQHHLNHYEHNSHTENVKKLLHQKITGLLKSIEETNSKHDREQLIEMIKLIKGSSDRNWDDLMESLQSENAILDFNRLRAELETEEEPQIHLNPQNSEQQQDHERLLKHQFDIVNHHPHGHHAAAHHHHAGDKLDEHHHLQRGPHGSLVITSDEHEIKEKINIHSHEMKPNHAGAILTYENHHSDHGKNHRHGEAEGASAAQN